MTGAARAARFLILGLWMAGFGCASDGDLRGSTVESSALQLEAATRSGYPTELVVQDEQLDAHALLGRQATVDPKVTYLVLTRTDAAIVWSDALRGTPPASEGAILGRWVAPFLTYDDRDTALKAFVFGYLRAMHEAGRIEWDTALVPFLGPRPQSDDTSPWGWLLALLVMLLVVRASRAVP